MAITPGTRIGPYEVTALLGEGGMGQVYRARDSKLHRDVAIKVLPKLFAQDAERLARFTREAQTLASLNHPNIAGIYGIEESESDTHATRALVMELVEGEDLSQIIARGPIAVADALPIATQIADALEAAHEQGIVHRDLKPANIKVRADGTVKVLDFGLAKAMDLAGGLRTQDSGPWTQDSSALTLTSPAMTAMGMIIGTAAYMAPEQAKGRAVDRRADIWAFGVVLHEMLTGRRLFDAEDVSETLAAVLTRDASLTAMPAGLPPRLRELLRDCLVRDPKQRLRDIGEARRRLDTIIAGEPDETAAAGAAAPGRRDRLAWIVAGISAMAAVVALTALWWPRESAGPAQRIQFSVPSDAEPASAFGVDRPLISPDGRLLAYIGPPAVAGVPAIWIRPLDASDARMVAGTSGAHGLFWSPDSKSIGYAVGDRIYRVGVSAAGGAPQPLCQLPDFVSAAWTRTGSVLLNTASVSSGMRLFQVSEQGGPPVELTLAGAEGVAESALWPALLPDSQHFIYLGWSLNSDDRALYVGSLDGSTPVRLMQTESMAVYVEPGFLLFVRQGTLFAQRFDAKALTLAGQPVRLADDVTTSSTLGRTAFSASDTGTLAYRTSGGTNGLSELVWVDRSGTVTGTVGDARKYYQIRLSPDGRRVATSTGDVGSTDLSVLDLANGVSSAVTDSQTVNDQAWSPDSRTVAYEADAGGALQFFTQVVGSQKEEPLFESPLTPKYLDDWSPDGKFVLFHAAQPGQLFVVPVDGSSEPRQLLDSTPGVDQAHFSPDGEWVAYQITESNTNQVWVASFPAFDQRRRVSPAGGGQPVWARDGRELFYLTPTGKLMAVPVDRSAGAIEFKAPVELFQSPLTSPALVIDQYSVSNDGQRFLFIRPRASTGTKPPITVVVNWAAGLAGR